MEKHPNSEMYDEIWRTKSTYKMKEWRQNNLRQWIQNKKPAKNYLDIGCGRAESLKIALNEGIKEVHGCEIAPYLCQEENIDMLPEGAQKLPYKDNEYELVSCLDVLEHVTPEEAAPSILELWRVCSRSVLIGIPHKKTPNPLHIIQTNDKWWLRLMEATNAKIKILKMKIPQVRKPYTYYELY